MAHNANWRPLAIDGSGIRAPGDPGRRFLVYLLCCRDSTSRAKHYVGLTTAENLRQRMRRHAVGTGSHVTRRWYLESSHPVLAGILLVDHPGREREIKSAGHFSSWCPVCAGLIAGEPLTMVAGIGQGHPLTANRNSLTLQPGGSISFDSAQDR